MLQIFLCWTYLRYHSLSWGNIISEFIEGYQQRKCFPRYFFINGYWTTYFKHSSDSPLASTVKIKKKTRDNCHKIAYNIISEKYIIFYSMHLKHVLVAQQRILHVLQIYASKIKGILQEVGSCSNLKCFMVNALINTVNNNSKP